MAGKVSRRCERKDFPDLAEAAGRQPGINPAIVEKDYYVTEALRIITGRFRKLVLFKCGASLSKGWKLLDRFPEEPLRS